MPKLFIKKLKVTNPEKKENYRKFIYKSFRKETKKYYFKIFKKILYPGYYSISFFLNNFENEGNISTIVRRSMYNNNAIFMQYILIKRIF